MASFRLADPVPPEVASALAHLPPLMAQLLFTRGLTTPEAIDAFLRPSYESHLLPPMLLPGMEAAVERLLRAIRDGTSIGIYSDYDCDGIPGGVVLHDFLTHVGHAAFKNYIPHRHYDGFGLSVSAVEAMAKDGISLIVTVDCGTTDVAAVARANELGVDVIITDHHQPGPVLPAAVAVVNPQLGDYPFRGLCGAAVAYKFAQATLEVGGFTHVPGQEKWWLDMVGLATIADMVPLVGENRVFAHYGLLVLRKTRRPGLLELFRAQRVNPRLLSEDDIGFTIGPRINAASRMDNPEDAFHMLATGDIARAATYAAHLEKLNSARKGIVAAMTREAHEHLRALEVVPDIIVLGNPAWRPALVGLVANKLAEEHGRPAFVWGRDGNGKLKGSCRSGGSVSVHALMEAVADHFHEFGGHHASGGFGVLEDAIHRLPQSLNDAYRALGEEAVVTTPLVVDAELAIDALTSEVLRAQQALAPFGAGNAKPVYLISAVPDTVSAFGKGKEHTKLTFRTRGIAREAIAFFKHPEQFSGPLEAGKPLQFLAHLESSTFMGRTAPRLRLIDVVS